MINADSMLIFDYRDCMHLGKPRALPGVPSRQR